MICWCLIFWFCFWVFTNQPNVHSGVVSRHSCPWTLVQIVPVILRLHGRWRQKWRKLRIWEEANKYYHFWKFGDVRFRHLNLGTTSATLNFTTGSCAGWGLWLLVLVTENKGTADMWHVTCDMWHVKYDMWHVTGDRWESWDCAPFFLFTKKNWRGWRNMVGKCVSFFFKGIIILCRCTLLHMRQCRNELQKEYCVKTKS